MTTSSRPKPPPPPAQNGKRPPAPQAQQTSDQASREFAITSGRIDRPQRVGLYGTGGIGKSTLASLAPNSIFLDIEGGTDSMDVPRIEREHISTFADLRACLQSSTLDGYGTVILDTATKAEEYAAEHVLSTIKHEKGHYVDNLEGYGFGKGYVHLFDAFLLLLSDLDRQIRNGRNVIVIAHECVNDVPNPVGDDWIRYEPHLQSPKKGKNNIRNRFIQWADHLLFMGYDVVSQNGKGIGGGTRTIYTQELPSHYAKSRTVSDNLPFMSPTDGAIWPLIFGGSCNE